GQPLFHLDQYLTVIVKPAHLGVPHFDILFTKPVWVDKYNNDKSAEFKVLKHKLDTLKDLICEQLCSRGIYSKIYEMPLLMAGGTSVYSYNNALVSSSSNPAIIPDVYLMNYNSKFIC
ncbi:MAG: hypothetical protein ACI959_001097, partial [Limisphaerales bacterium]